MMVIHYIWSFRLNTHHIVSGNVSKLLKKQKGLCNFCKLSFISQQT
jgi:hypothetical protein